MHSRTVRSQLALTSSRDVGPLGGVEKAGRACLIHVAVNGVVIAKRIGVCHVSMVIPADAGPGGDVTGGSVQGMEVETEYSAKWTQRVRYDNVTHDRDSGRHGPRECTPGEGFAQPMACIRPRGV